MNPGTHKVRGNIKGCIHVEANLFKVKVLQQGVTQVAHTDYNEAVALVNAQNMANFRAEFGNIVAIPLLAEFTEAAQILADLGGGDVHFAAQGVGGNAYDSLVIQIVQITIVAGKTVDNGVRYLLLSHKTDRSFTFAFD